MKSTTLDLLVTMLLVVNMVVTIATSNFIVLGVCFVIAVAGLLFIKRDWISKKLKQA